MEECIFDYMALKIECRFNKDSLLRGYFLAILPAGKSRNYTLEALFIREIKPDLNTKDEFRSKQLLIKM